MKLTDREDQIFGMVRSGLTSRQIGVRLGISSRTVDEHRQSCKLKLGGGNVVEQVAKYNAMKGEAS